MKRLATPNSFLTVLGLLALSIFAWLALGFINPSPALAQPALSPNNFPSLVRDWINDKNARCGGEAEKYQLISWMSARDDPSNMGPVVVPYGASEARLRLNFAVFLCHDIVNVDPNRPIPGLPNDGNPTSAAKLRQSYNYIHSYNAIPDGFLEPAPTGVRHEVGFNGGTRYWFGAGLGSVFFDYHNQGNVTFTQSKTIRIVINSEHANHFASGAYICGANGRRVGGPPPAGCPVEPLSFTVQIQVQEPRGTITGDKVNIANNSRSGAFSGNHVSVDGVGGTNSNPYSFGVRGDRNYTIRAANGPNEWQLREVCINGSCRGTGGAETVHVPPNGSVDVRWRYHQRDWNLDVSLFPIGPWPAQGVEPATRYWMIAEVCNRGEWPSGSATLFTRVSRGNDSWVSVKDPPSWSYNIGSVRVGCGVVRQFGFEISNNAPHNVQICFQAHAQPERRSGGTAGSNQVCTTIKQPREPYLTTTGGDVHAGYEYGSEPCLLPTNSLARIRGNVSGSFGSKADFVVSAGGRIRQFGSAGQPAGNSLTLGNNAGDGFYGQVCRPDQFEKLWGHPDAVVATSANQVRNLLVSSGADNLIINYDGNLTLRGPIQIPKGKHVTLVVSGGVHITRGGNGAGITLHPGPYTASGRSPAIQNVPSFALITRDDIRIDNSITRLDGIYYAGTTGNTGTIDTCGNSATGSGPRITGNGEAANCDNRLLVRGALVADQIRFRRTPGDVKIDKDAAAEQVSFLAQLSLQPPPGFNLLIASLLYNGERPPTF